MRIVLWQNCLSPHQLPYIVHLLDDDRVDSVVIAAGEAVNAERAKMGWCVAEYSGLDRCEVYLNPHPLMMDSLLATRTDDSWHLFSGIRDFQFVFKAFLQSLKYNLRRGLIKERPITYAHGSTNGKPLWMHRLRFLLRDRKFAPSIDMVFAMGDEAVDYFQSVWKQWAVHPFAYCTNPSLTPAIQITGPTRFVFVGSLSPRKSPLTILDAQRQIVNNCKRGGVILNFVGDGPERLKIEQAIENYNLQGVSLLGTKQNDEIASIISQHDVLILPSLHDGWGAVVNEALTQGLYVICSDRCGAKELIYNPRRGRIFKANDCKQLADCMQYCITHIENIRKDVDYRRQWARQCISGEAISRYMVDCLSGKDVQRPWID